MSVADIWWKQPVRNRVLTPGRPIVPERKGAGAPPLVTHQWLIGDSVAERGFGGSVGNGALAPLTVDGVGTVTALLSQNGNADFYAETGVDIAGTDPLWFVYPEIERAAAIGMPRIGAALYSTPGETALRDYLATVEGETIPIYWSATHPDPVDLQLIVDALLAEGWAAGLVNAELLQVWNGSTRLDLTLTQALTCDIAHLTPNPLRVDVRQALEAEGITCGP